MYAPVSIWVSPARNTPDNRTNTPYSPARPADPTLVQNVVVSDELGFGGGEGAAGAEGRAGQVLQLPPSKPEGSEKFVG